MITTHNLGFPRIGKKRELKFALEDYWHGRAGEEKLQATAAGLRKQHWQTQACVDYAAVGDFSLYDQVLDMSFTLGNIPARVREKPLANELDNYFRVARGRSVGASDCECVQAGEMTKWFDTNYHYIVPEFDSSTEFNLNPTRLLQQFAEAKAAGVNAKPVIIGPLTYLALGVWKSDGCKGDVEKNTLNKLDLLPRLLAVYRELLQELVAAGADWVQIDEPILVTELAQEWQQAFGIAYHQLKATGAKLLLATYFGELRENLQLTVELPVQGLHLDVSNRDTGSAEQATIASGPSDELIRVLDRLPAHKILSLGVVDGRNIWRNDLTKTLDWLEPVAEKLGDRLWLAPSCSLLHLPVDLAQEQHLDAEIKPWLAFATQKLSEVALLAKALNHGRESINAELEKNRVVLQARKNSPRVNRPSVKAALSQLTPAYGERKSPYSVRALVQRTRFRLPNFPTTTIGSFPQTGDIRAARRKFRNGELTELAYRDFIQQQIRESITQQEKLGLDVLVHGEAERNDMVEYFGEQLEGFIFSALGWVQSYGSRCVKPPIIYGDIDRQDAMTLSWIAYAQTLTERPVKGMLTGPVTILNWSFVRNDQARATTAKQIALAIRKEVLDLEKTGVAIIQIDEAALREGLPLRKSEWNNYLNWAIESFRIAANGVADSTQIHTHMCYSDFNDIIEAIAHMDADVITIETSRSNMKLLDVFEKFSYPNEIGPGVYDIHSPNIPTEEAIVALMEKAALHIPSERLWVNPDCGLKTRQWQEVLPALRNMVSAAKQLRSAKQLITEQLGPEKLLDKTATAEA